VICLIETIKSIAVVPLLPYTILVFCESLEWSTLSKAVEKAQNVNVNLSSTNIHKVREIMYGKE